MHAALVLGLGLVGVVFFFLLRINGPSFPNASILAYVTAGLPVGNITAALTLFRPKIPQRGTGQAPDDYWALNEVRGLAILVWAIIEGGGLIAWMGYLLTGAVLPAAVGVFTIVILILVRPGRLEGDAAA